MSFSNPAIKGRLTFQHLPKFKPKLTRGHWTTRSTDTTGQQNPHRILRMCLQSKHKRMTDRTHDVDGVLVGSKCQCCFLLFVEMLTYPIGSMYGVFTYIYHKYQPNVGQHTIHGSSGYWYFKLNLEDAWSSPFLSSDTSSWEYQLKHAKGLNS